jgi:hypothetical protein
MMIYHTAPSVNPSTHAKVLWRPTANPRVGRSIAILEERIFKTIASNHSVADRIFFLSDRPLILQMERSIGGGGDQFCLQVWQRLGAGFGDDGGDRKLLFSTRQIDRPP